jgi:hypothetical protein
MASLDASLDRGVKLLEAPGVAAVHERYPRAHRA